MNSPSLPFFFCESANRGGCQLLPASRLGGQAAGHAPTLLTRNFPRPVMDGLQTHPRFPLKAPLTQFQ